MKIVNTKIYRLLICIICLFNYCASSNMFIRNDIDYSKYKRIAVLPLSDYPLKPGSGIQIADMLSIHLLNSNYNIIDRSQTMQILQEQSLGLSGVIDENTAPTIGRLLGVQAIITGSVTEYNCIVTNIQMVQGAQPAYMPISKAGIALKMVDTESGQIIWAGTANGTQVGQNVEIKAVESAIKSILKKFKSLNLKNIQNTSPIPSVQTMPKTLLPNLRNRNPKYSSYTDEQIVNAFRKVNPQYQTKSDIWIINYLESRNIRK